MEESSVCLPQGWEIRARAPATLIALGFRTYLCTMSWLVLFCSFESVRATCCAQAQGVWYYEVTLFTSGIMQVSFPQLCCVAASSKDPVPSPACSCLRCLSC